jgi:hypothetical protein
MSGEHDESRREVIRKGLVLGSVGYVAPMILGSATPASAQISGSGCASTITACDESALEEFRCSAELECICVTSTEGAACVQVGGLPEPASTCCDTSEDCDDDWLCVDFSGVTGCEPPFCNEDERICFPVCGVFPEI